MPVFACHQHFLADVGKDLLDPSHAALRDLFRHTGLRQKLRDLTRELGRELGEGADDARKAVRTWQSLAVAGHRVPSGREGIAVGVICSGKIYDHVKEYVGVLPKKGWKVYDNVHQEWGYITFGYRYGSWKKYYRAIYTCPAYEGGQ